MIIWGAATLAYDENEIHLDIETEKRETIALGDIISIPMNNHTFVKRKVVGIFKNWKKWRDGKSLDRINEGENATVSGINSGMVHMVSSPYDNEELGEDCVSAFCKQESTVSFD